MSSAGPVFRLYDGPPPGSEEWIHGEQENFSPGWQTQVVFNVVDPTLTLIAPASGTGNGTAIIICPGGGFHALSIDSEGFAVANWLADRGVTCFVLKYRLVHCQTEDPAAEMDAKTQSQMGEAVEPVIPLAVADAQAALAYVRQHAQTYGVDPQRIGIIGFSAGGTVAAATAFQYSPQIRPDFVAPIYLQYTWVKWESVPADAPPLFLLAATDDEVGLAPHSVQMYTDWTGAQKSAELHIYATGGHGFGMRIQGLPSDRWISLFGDWLGVQGMLPARGDKEQ